LAFGASFTFGSDEARKDLPVGEVVKFGMILGTEDSFPWDGKDPS